MGGDKRPAFQFYPDDWVADPDLQACSLAAQGLWIRMLCVMHRRNPYGHLVTKRGTPMAVATLARLASATPEAIDALLEELGEFDVFSITDQGVIFSRRMVKDGEKYQAYVDSGRKGGLAKAAKGGVAKESYPPLDQPYDENSKGGVASESYSPTPSPDSSLPTPRGEWFLSIWNDACETSGLPSIRVWTDTRQGKLTRLNRDHTQEVIAEVVTACHTNIFLTGDNERGWKANADWLLKPANFVKVLERSYERKKKRNPLDTWGGAEDWGGGPRPPKGSGYD